MILEFERVQIENFMSLGYADIDLSDRGYVSIYGINNNDNDFAKSNGSGKSSIFESIVWCLSGETIRGNKDVVNRHFDNGTKVTLRFKVDGVGYEVVRAKDHPELKTNLKIYINGEDKSGKGIRGSEKLLKEYLPDLTASLISSVIILGQGMPNRFTNNTPVGRKEVLEKLCKSDFMIEDLKNRVSFRKNELQESIRTTEDSLLRDNTKLDGLKTSHIELESKFKELEDVVSMEGVTKELEESLSVKLKEMERCESTRKTIESDLDSINAIILKLDDEKQSELDSIDSMYKSDVDSLSTNVATLQSSLKYKLEELDKMLKITDVCPTCGQKLPDVHKPDVSPIEEEIERLKKELYDAKLEHSNKLNEYLSKSESTRQLYRKKNKSYVDSMNELKFQVSKLTNRIGTLNTEINDVKIKLSTISYDIENRKKNVEEIKLKLSEHKFTIASLEDDILYNNNVLEDLNNRLQVINKFNNVLTREFRGYLLQDIIEYIDSRAKQYCESIFNTKLIEFKLDGNNISISYDGKLYEALSGGERQKVDIIVQFSIRDMLCKYTNFSTNLLALDEIFDNLDDIGCQRIVDMISTKLSDISSIFIISHHCRELNIPYDEEIVVVKDSNGVSVVK